MVGKGSLIPAKQIGPDIGNLGFLLHLTSLSRKVWSYEFQSRVGDLLEYSIYTFYL